MAIANKQVIVIKPEQVIPAVTEEKIVLELSKEEAETLQEILARIGGSPEFSPRKHCDSVHSALNNAGIGRIARVSSVGVPMNEVTHADSSYIMFKNYNQF